MEFIIEILVDCVLSLIVDSGVDVMTGSEQSKRLPKGARIALVAATLLIFTAIIGAMVIFGILMLIDREWVPGIILTAVGIVFAVVTIVKFLTVYRKKKSE